MSYSYYNGEHSITFVTNSGVQANTWTDWLLIPNTRPTIQPPTVQEFSLDIPGRSGKLDFSEYVSASPVYNNRTGSLEFIVDHANENYISWETTKETILAFIHGKNLKMILQDEPDYYYEGKITVNELASNADWSTITLDYDLKPYRLSVTNVLSDWLWDPFNFITGYIRNMSDFEVAVNSSQGAVKFDIEGVEQESQVEIASNSAAAKYQVFCKNNARYDRYYSGNSTDILKFTIYPNSPEFYILLSAPTNTNVKFYVKFIGGKL